MKFAPELFPKGSFPRQQTDGAYIHEFLSPNLDTYAKKIVNDMHFALVISGNDAVGNGKTTMATHLGSYLTWKINKLHGTKNTFTHNNMVFKSKDLAKKSFELPKYSVIVLDEGDDMVEHGMKETAREMKKYFRKCRQLNQIFILILPSFFELPKFYALARTHALINVKFHGQFERGLFHFYGPKQKKQLYLKGKKDWNYDSAPFDFDGDFFSSYAFFPNCKEEAELYKKGKYKDMIRDDEEEDIMSVTQQLRRQKIKFLINMTTKFPDLTFQSVCDVLEFTTWTGRNYLEKYKLNSEGMIVKKEEKEGEYINLMVREENDTGGTDNIIKEKEVINNEDNT